MELYFEKLNQLIALKKVKGHKITKKESDDFVSAWSELVAAEKNYTDIAEQYYYDGFIFAGAKPFVQWMLSTSDQYSSLDSLFNGKLFGKDTAASFRILVSTLAQLIIANPSDKNLVCPVIKRIPSVSKNKEHKTVGDGHRALLKYFISEISNDTVLPVLSELNINQGYVRSFIAVFDELFRRLDLATLSKKEAQAVAIINSWLHPVTDVEETDETGTVSTKEPVNNTKEEPANSSPDTEQTSTQSQSDSYDRLISLLNEAVSLSSNLRGLSKITQKKRMSLQGTINSLQREIEGLNKRLEEAKQRETALEELLDERNNRVAVLNSQVTNLGDEVQSLSRVIEAKDKEIEQRTQMMDALSRDRAKQSDEQMHRLASQLKVEYRDFKDAEALPMDSDLGENMREQLKNVFAILIRTGISLD